METSEYRRALWLQALSAMSPEPPPKLTVPGKPTLARRTWDECMRVFIQSRRVDETEKE